MEFMFGIFALTGAWVWFLASLWVILMLTSIEKESGLGAFFTLFFFVLILHTGGVINVLGVMFANPLTFVIGVVAYFVLGTAWSAIKYKFYLRKLRVSANKLIEQGTSENDWDLRAKITRLTDVDYNLHRIIHWAVWWPFSLVWTCVSDLVVDVFTWIIDDVVKKIFQKITESESSKLKSVKKK
ncbi:MAG: hypothetical protein ACP5N7_06440 [Candidatus Pacearchaeota archaeon]